MSLLQRLLSLFFTYIMSFLIFSLEEITLGFGLGHILADSVEVMGIPPRQAPLSCPLPLLRHYGINWSAFCAGYHNFLSPGGLSFSLDSCRGKMHLQ